MGKIACRCWNLGFLSLTVLWLTAGFSQESKPGGDAKTVVITANPAYEMIGFGRWFWGDHYRTSWATPTKFPVLDLKNYAGGLRVVGAGAGGAQTKRLNFVAADGRSYAFRSIDKDPSVILPEELRESLAADVVQDQISASHPAGTSITDYLEEALGILHAKPYIAVMPDDAALGEYREEFAGLLGQLVELPGKHQTPDAIFAGADAIGNGNIAFERSQANPKERVNGVALLKARLFDIFIGDWDRHRWQWRWAKLKGDPTWHPIPEDRDQAFSKMDGLFPSMAQNFVPQLVGFNDNYPDMFNLTFNGREVDRRFLVWLEKPVWDSLATAITGQLTDQLIEQAVRQLPPEMYAVDGAELERKLKTRRDNLSNAASKWYTYQAETVEIHTTDVEDRVMITQSENGRILVSVSENNTDGHPYAKREFDPQETREIRFRMHKGNDVVVVNGGENLPLTVRILGGEGDDELHYETVTTGIKFYDHAGNNSITGKPPDHSDINNKPYDEWVFAPDNRFMPLQWWRRSVPVAVTGYNPDYGFTLGYGRTWIEYGFRKDPYARRIALSGALSSQLKWDASLDTDFRFENTPWHFTFLAQATQLEVLHFYGFGNDSKRDEDEDFHAVDQSVVTLLPGISRQFTQKKTDPETPLSYNRQTAVSLGLAVRYSSTEASNNIIGAIPNLYGARQFGQVAAYARFLHDSRDMGAAPTKGTTLRINGVFIPEIWHVNDTYGWLDATGSIYLSTPGPFAPVLALRAGGKKIWGDFPYFDAAFLGGVESLRGWDRERFAGDLSLYGSSELRLLLAETKLLLISHLGVLGFVDGGRVYLDGDSPGSLHYGYGGGIWMSFLGRPNTASFAFANSDDGLKFYVVWGFAF